MAVRELVIWSAEIMGGRIEHTKLLTRINIRSNAASDRLDDVNRCIGLTGNKLLYPLRHEATSAAASAGFHRGESEQNIQRVFFCFNPDPCIVLPVGLFQPAIAEADQNTENRVTSWPQAQTTETAAAIKTEFVGHTMETPYELVMIQITLLAPDNDNPFLVDSKKLPRAEHNEPRHIFQVKRIL